MDFRKISTYSFKRNLKMQENYRVKWKSIYKNVKEKSRKENCIFIIFIEKVKVCLEIGKQLEKLGVDLLGGWNYGFVLFCF